LGNIRNTARDFYGTLDGDDGILDGVATVEEQEAE
jgi:hypothetical protein